MDDSKGYRRVSLGLIRLFLFYRRKENQFQENNEKKEKKKKERKKKRNVADEKKDTFLRDVPSEYKL